MAEKTDRRYCAECDRRVLAVGNKPNHLLHLVLTLCTAGLWAFVWIILALVGSPYRCSKCGSRV